MESLEDPCCPKNNAGVDPKTLREKRICTDYRSGLKTTLHCAFFLETGSAGFEHVIFVFNELLFNDVNNQKIKKFIH